MQRRLERYLDEAHVGGVAAGLAHYFNIDRTLVRVLFVVGFFVPHFPSVIIYLILWVALPERRYVTTTGDTLASIPQYQIPFSTMSRYNDNNRNGNIFGGITLIIIGVLFLLDRWLDIDFGDMWPLLLVALGVWLLFKDRIRPNGGSDDTPTTTNYPPYSSTTNDPANPNNPL